MSLPTDIIQLFGTGSVPVIVAGTVYGVFELGEKLASQRAKDALSKWLLTFDVQKAKALPDGTQELFERIFGERHFSLKCLVRSAVFSLGAMVFIAMLCLLIRQGVLNWLLWFPGLLLPYTMVWLAIWLLWSILIDYISLLKTRVILRIMTRIHPVVLPIAILLVDFLVYIVIFFIGLILVTWLVGLTSVTWMRQEHPVQDGIAPATSLSLVFVYIIPAIIALTDERFFLAFIGFWSGFVPSIWMWLYVLALFVTRVLLRSEKLIGWLRWALDIEKAPFRSIGAVAATLAFIASVAIILVSAEVSRISAA